MINRQISIRQSYNEQQTVSKKIYEEVFKIFVRFKGYINLLFR